MTYTNKNISIKNKYDKYIKFYSKNKPFFQNLNGSINMVRHEIEILLILAIKQLLY